MKRSRWIMYGLFCVAVGAGLYAVVAEWLRVARSSTTYMGALQAAQQGQHDRAIELTYYALAFDSSTYTPYCTLGTELKTIGRYDAAREALVTCQELIHRGAKSSPTGDGSPQMREHDLNTVDGQLSEIEGLLRGQGAGGLP